MAWDLKLSETTNDLQFDRSEISTTDSKQELLRQRISITIKTWLEEWFWNSKFGIPYRQVLFSQKISKEQVDAIFLSTVTSFDEVIYIQEFTSEVNTATRTYDLLFHVYTDQGEDAFYIRLGGPNAKIDYTDTTASQAIICPAGTLSVEFANLQYKLVNIDIPLTIPWI